MAININDYKEKRSINYIETNRLWTKHLQFKDGFVYATDSNIIARVKGTNSENVQMFQKNLNFDAFFERKDFYGYVERKTVNRLLNSIKLELKDSKELKVKGLYFQKKYLKKMFSCGKEAKVYNSCMPSMYVFVFDEIEFALMAVMNVWLADEVPIINKN